ncbi:glutaminyl-peptide cyclotransferase [Thalassophryne amazonica]|uniref:glutaminyl-peptide cyclotransferase n=1 Tax=Thalassophryne amazonica TaxID=390379 RepID=UPI001470F9C9|nr:glutaminyl-peptide cyclotransferase [Thalassophryne amazonica]
MISSPRRGTHAAMTERRYGGSTTRFFLTVWLTVVHGSHGIVWTYEKFRHQAITLTPDEIRSALSHTDLDQMWQRALRPLLVTRYPSSAGSVAVQEHIRSTLGSLSAGWEVTGDSFESQTPYGPLTFTNIIATLDPSARRRLVLACHHDSKYYPPQWHGREFLGATDSAVPCAMILELAQALDEDLKAQKVRGTEFHHHSASFPQIYELHKQTAHSLNQLLDHPNNVQYFWPNLSVSPIQDDHVPFLNRGVHTLHLIPTPFPSVWHTFDDDEQHLDRSTIQNLNRILQVFVLEYLNVRPAAPPPPPPTQNTL